MYTNTLDAVNNTKMVDHIYVLQTFNNKYVNEIKSYKYDTQLDFKHTDLLIQFNDGHSIKLDVKKPTFKNRENRFAVSAYSESVFNENSSYFAFIDISYNNFGNVYVIEKQKIHQYILNHPGCKREKNENDRIKCYYLIDRHYIIKNKSHYSIIASDKDKRYLNNFTGFDYNQNIPLF